MHTPGPWEVGIKHPCRVFNRELKKQIALTCPEMDDTAKDHTEEQSANARLTAAAPDLLQACKLAHTQLSDLHKMLYPCCDGDGCLTHAITEKLSAAIAKAEKGIKL